MSSAAGTFRRRSCRDAMTVFAPLPRRGICIGYGRRLVFVWFPMRDIQLLRPATFTNSSARPTDIAAADRMRPSHRTANAVVASLLCAICLPWMQAAQAAGTKLLRFPDVWRDRVVFSYAGDLWTVGTHGGTATRLTAHPGLELFGKFSPDGRHIAFTGQYGGDEQVYVIPSDGAAPKQLTFYPSQGPLADRWGFDNQ